MLVYAGETHARILDALDTYISDEEWEAIEASAQRLQVPPVVPLGAHFPGWHSALDAGW